MYTSYSRKDLLMVLSVFIPIASRWFLPSGLENQMILETFPIYLPNLFFLYFVINSHLSSGRKKYFFLIIIYIVTCLFNSIINEYSNFIYGLLCGSYFVPAIILGTRYKLSLSQIKLLRIFLFISLILLTIEIYLYSLGILKYSIDLTENSIQYGSFYRISTTIAAATGTSCVMCMLSVMCYSLFPKQKIGYISIFLGIASILALTTRGSLLAIACFIILQLYEEFKKSFSNSIKYIFVFFIILILIYNLGLFDGIIERTEILSEGDVTTGREKLWQKAFYYYSQTSQGLYINGAGPANIFCSKDATFLHFKSMYHSAPHNVYIMVLTELGILGIIVFACLILKLFKNLYRNKRFLSCWITILVLFSSEAVIGVDSEYLFLISLFLMVALNIDEKKIEEKYIDDRYE